MTPLNSEGTAQVNRRQGCESGLGGNPNTALIVTGTHSKKIFAPPLSGPAAIQAFLAVEDPARNEFWVKYGHSNFGVMHRSVDGIWRFRGSTLQISKERVTAGHFTDAERTLSRTLELKGQGTPQVDGWQLLIGTSHKQEGGAFYLPGAYQADIPGNAGINLCDDLGCEIDDAPRDEQLARYHRFEQVTGLTFALMLSSGSKSVHTHVKTDRPYPVAELADLRFLLVLVLLGDPAVTRPHQPMRLPGAFRKEKGNYQELLQTDPTARYSPEQISEGLQRAFADRGWTWPTDPLHPQLKLDLQRALKASDCDRIAALLTAGNAPYEAKATQTQQRQAQRQAFQQLTGQLGSSSLYDAIKDVEGRETPQTAFGWDSERRGCCPFHDSQSGNSAWVDESQDGIPRFHCGPCGLNLSPFYFWAKQRGHDGPKGQLWAELGKEWLSLHSIDPTQFDRTRTASVPIVVPIPVPPPQTNNLLADSLAAQEHEEAVKAVKSAQAAADRAAQKLFDKQKAELEKWLAVALQIDAGFQLTGKLEKDIAAAKALVLADTNKKATYTSAVLNWGGTFTHGTLQSLLDNDGPVVISGQTGGGKTEIATQLCAYAARLKADTTYSAIAPTQVLSEQLAGRFESKGLPMESTAFTDNSSSTPKPKAMPAEGIWRLLRELLDFLTVDECDQVIPRLLAGALGDAPDANLAALEQLIQSVPNQFWLNADVNPITVELLAEISGASVAVLDLQREQSNRPVTVTWYRDYYGEFGPDLIMGSNQLYTDYIAAAKAGKRVLLLAGSVKKARAIKKELQAAGLRVLLKDGRYTPKKQRLGFAQGPDKACAPYDVVILTRLVETGIDIQKDWDSVYVCLSPKMTARSAYQFLSRSRSLLRGDTPRLNLYVPDQNFTAVEQLSPAYWYERQTAENKLYLSLLKKDTAKAQEKIERIQWAARYLAKYRADEARQLYFRDEMLADKFAELGWSVTYREVIADQARTMDQLLKDRVYQADMIEAACIARGHGSINEYPEAYAAKILDPQEQGLILDCKRRKVELASLLPLSPLADKHLIYQLEHDQRLLAQSLMWSAVESGPNSEKVQKLMDFLADSHIDKFEVYGPMEGLKQLKKSKSVLTLAIAEQIADHPFLNRVLGGSDEIHSHQPDTQDFARLLGSLDELLNAWCEKRFGAQFNWNMDCAASVALKALNKLFGISTVAGLQISIKDAEGVTKRPRIYRTALSEKGRQLIAEAEKKNSSLPISLDDHRAQVDAEAQQRLDLCRSAQAGWDKKIDWALALLERGSRVLHTDFKNEKNIGLEKGVQCTGAGGAQQGAAPSSPPLKEPPINKQMALMGWR